MHLKTGEYVFLNKTIPKTDPFSFANDSIPFIGKFILTQYWASQIFFFLTHKMLGPFWLVLLGAITLTLTVIILWLLIRGKGFYISLFITGGFAFNVLNNFIAIRPQIFTFLFTALLIFLIEKYKEKDSIRYLLPMPFLMVLWANMHGGYIYGVVILAIYLFSEGTNLYLQKKSFHIHAGQLSAKQSYYLFVFCIISILISLVNPNTYKAFTYAFITHSQNLFSNIDEYQSPFNIMKVSMQRKWIYSFWLYLFVATALIMVFIKQRNLNPLLLLVFSMIPSLISIRYIPLFAIVATATFRYVPMKTKSKMPSKSSLVASILIILSLGILIFTSNPFKNKNIYILPESYCYAVNASNFLKKNKISGNIFSSYTKSAYLIFSLFPESKVYSDSRYISEERIKVSLKIDGELDPIKERLDNINRVIPRNIGTIDILEMEKGKQNHTSNPLGLQNTMTDDKTWKDLLDDINAEIIVHEAVNFYSGTIYPFIFKLMQEDAWKLIYLDGNVMVFVKDIPKFKDIITQHEKSKMLIYDEIIIESLRGIDKNISHYHSSMALALLLKGIADNNTNYFIEKALSLDSDNIIAHYSRALFVLMTQKK